MLTKPQRGRYSYSFYFAEGEAEPQRGLIFLSKSYSLWDLDPGESASNTAYFAALLLTGSFFSSTQVSREKELRNQTVFFLIVWNLYWWRDPGRKHWILLGDIRESPTEKETQQCLHATISQVGEQREGIPRWRHWCEYMHRGMSWLGWSQECQA